MARDPEDQHGASSAGGEDPTPENSPTNGESAASPEESQQEELPLGEADEASEKPSEEPASTEESSEETETAHDDQADDPATHEDPGYDDPYAHDYHYDAEDQYHEYHDEYHHDQYEEDYESNYTPTGHDDFHDTASSSGGGTGGYGGGYYDDDEEDDEEEESEEFGGPVKPFLAHLEDLRWTVMKCVIALMVGMLVALMGAGYIIDFLAGPLKKAQRMEKVLAQSNPHKRTIPIQIGEGVVGTIHEADLQNLQKKGLLQNSATNLAEITSISLRPIAVAAPDANGTRYRMEMIVDTNGSKEVKWSLELKAFGPMKGFMIALRIGFYGGFALSFPLIIYFIAQFVVPALRVREKQWLGRLAAAGSILFAIGVAFAYFIIMKIALWASVGFAEMLGLHADEWQAEEYISFVCMFLIGMGVAFQLPMVLLFLVKVGLLDYKKLAEWRMYAVVANLIVSAILTPTGDPVTLLLVAAPLHLLYEISIIIAWFMYRSKARKEAAEEAEYEREFGDDQEDFDDEGRDE